MKFGALILLNTSPPQKLVLTPGAICRGNTVIVMKFADDMVNTLRSEDHKLAQLYEDARKKKELRNIDENATFLQRMKNFALTEYAIFYRG